MGLITYASKRSALVFLARDPSLWSVGCRLPGRTRRSRSLAEKVILWAALVNLLETLSNTWIFVEIHKFFFFVEKRGTFAYKNFFQLYESKVHFFTNSHLYFYMKIYF